MHLVRRVARLVFVGPLADAHQAHARVVRGRVPQCTRRQAQIGAGDRVRRFGADGDKDAFAPRGFDARGFSTCACVGIASRTGGACAFVFERAGC